MNTIVRETGGRQAQQFVSPAASVIEHGEGYLLQIEMAGVNKEGLEISTQDNELTITGRRSLSAIEGTLLHHELHHQNFRRSFELDPSIDVNKICARIDQGLLTITLPKADHVKPRMIEVS